MAAMVEVIERPAIRVISKRTMVDLAGIGAVIGRTFGEAYAALGRQRVAPAGPPFVIYHGMPGAGPFEIQVCAPVGPGATAPAGWVLEELPAGTAATVTHVGPYDSIGAAYDAIWAWLPPHGLEPAGAPREVYMSPPGTPPAAIRTVVDVPVRAAGTLAAAAHA
jgi:effector-binding domain-containing protein